MNRNNYPYYKVETYNGQLLNRSGNEQVTIFQHDDLLAARKDALLFAFIKEQNPDYEPSSLVRKKYQRLNTMISFEIAVYLVISATEECQIFGDQIHETLSGLKVEACYLVKNALIKPTQLLKGWQNTDESDEIQPFEMLKGKDSKKKGFVQIEVVEDMFTEISERSEVFS